ncbi:hypothetical protein M6B38_329260 [Iris pallida]|uniref:Uncharacterized protein n=1 Tax=Iris pallida TaxID=29817 RepID=A0AAX6H4P1_IRIPA|nr:hypothetical protein M6B38_329260 [Iris pallida]
MLTNPADLHTLHSTAQNKKKPRNPIPKFPLPSISFSAELSTTPTFHAKPNSKLHLFPLGTRKTQPQI